MNYSLLRLLQIFVTCSYMLVFPSFHCLQNTNYQDGQENGNLLREEIQLFDWKILQKEIQGVSAIFFIYIKINL